MMHTKYYDNLLQTTDDETADTHRHLQEGGNRTENRRFQRMHNGANDEDTQNHGDEQRNERRNNQVDNIGNYRLESLLQFRSKDTENKCRQYRPLITNDANGHTKDFHRNGLHITTGNSPGIRQLRANEHEAQHQTNNWRTAEAFHGRPANECRQEDEGRIRENLAQQQHIIAELYAQTLCRTAQAHEQTGCHQYGDDGYEYVTQRTGNLLQRRHLGISFFLVADTGEIRALDEFCKDLVHKTRA